MIASFNLHWVSGFPSELQISVHSWVVKFPSIYAEKEISFKIQTKIQVGIMEKIESSKERYVLFRKYNSFVPEYLSLSAGSMTRYSDQDFYVITPQFTIIDVMKTASQFNLLVVFNSVDFLRMIDQIDGMLLQMKSVKMNENINDLVRNFKSSKLLDPVSLEWRLMEFKIPTVDDRPTAKIFDEFSDPIGIGVLAPGFCGSAIIRPREMKPADLCVRWIIEQIKVTIPEAHFGRCVLNDEREDLEIIN